MTATNTTESQLFSHTRALVEKLSAEKDVAKISASVPKSLAIAIPEPVLYEHGDVGECNDLIFGFSLVDYATANNLTEGEIPRIVKICISEIDGRGLDAEGIYRVSGRHANVQAAQHAIEKDEADFSFTTKDDIYVVASLLKLYLREIPEPLFRYSLQDRVQHTHDFAEHKSNNFMLLRSKIRRLPPVHQATLKALLEHLARVAANQDKNKMDVKNLSIVFGSVIFGDDEIPKGTDLLSVHTWKDTLMEDLITHVNLLFEEHLPNTSPHAPPTPLHQPPPNASPPLPPTPAGEPVPPITYGSKTTKISNIGLSNSPAEDFTPRLPARPASSIHPSARANTSPTKDRGDRTNTSQVDTEVTVKLTKSLDVETSAPHESSEALTENSSPIVPKLTLPSVDESGTSGEALS